MKVARSREAYTQKPYFVPDTSKRICIRNSSNKTGEWDISLEKLPPVLLDEIFQYVQSYDLTKLAWLSKSFYWPAVTRIYKSISVYEPPSPDGKVYEFSDCRQYWKFNHGTPTKRKHFESFESVVKKNRGLGAMVQTLNYYQLYLTFHLNIIVSYLPKLKALYDHTGFVDPWYLPRKSQLTAMTVSIERYHNIRSPLVELRLVGDCKDWYGELACDMITSRNYLNLQRLDFSTEDTRNYHSMPLGPYPPENNFPDWTGFVDKFVSAGVKLNLSALGISGTLYNRYGRVVMQLRKFTDFHELKTLTLKHSEDDYPDQEYLPDEGFEGVDATTFLEAITRFTPRLETLAIYPVYENYACDIDSICNVLRNNIPHQLKHFSIEYLPPADGKKCRVDIQNALISSQRYLKKLKIENELSLVSETEAASEPGLVAISANMAKDWYKEVRRAQLFPRILDGHHRQTYIPEESARCIKDHIGVIHKWLLEDPVYTNAEKELPHLTQYYVGRLFIDMKEKGVFVNDETVLFEPKVDDLGNCIEVI